jgi:hypothetical protein
MKTKVLLAVSSALIGVAVTSCGGGSGGGYGENGNVATGSSSGSTTSAEPQTLTTQQVLALAQQPSETAEPFAVNGGQTAITPADDETSKPGAI